MRMFVNTFRILLLFSTLVFATGLIITDSKTTEEIVNTQEAVDIVDLSAKSSSGLYVCNFRIKSLPDAKSGILYMKDGVTAVKVNQNLTQDEANSLMFDPKEGYVGNATFTYTGVDSNGDEGSVATVTLPIVADDSEVDNSSTDVIESNSSVEGEGIDVSNVVTTDDKMNPNMLNTLPAVDILDLSGKDANGVLVDNFVIKSLPNEESGTLYMADGITGVIVEQNLTRDESDGLKFDPKESYVGDANFTYQAIDSSGNLGNVAVVTIPIVGEIIPDKNGSKKGCICNDYNKNIPTLNIFGLFFIAIFTSLFGVLFIKRELL